MQEEDEQPEEKTSRKRFLRQVGMTLLAAIGAGALAEAAFANPGQCCYDCGGCGGCSTPDAPNGCYCRCDCTGISQSYCWNYYTGCLSGGCVSCPC